MEEQVVSVAESDNASAIPVYKSPYNNPYILNRYSKEDLKFTRKKYRQYKFSNIISKLKTFQKSKGRLANWLVKYKNKIHYIEKINIPQRSSENERKRK